MQAHYLEMYKYTMSKTDFSGIIQCILVTVFYNFFLYGRLNSKGLKFVIFIFYQRDISADFQLYAILVTYYYNKKKYTNISLFA